MSETEFRSVKVDAETHFTLRVLSVQLGEPIYMIIRRMVEKEKPAAKNGKKARNKVGGL